ncbi:hypothetical protein [Pedobacter sp.]|uniref:hypothetical protein n=1 Tax=Pedobacter sp. TaxID=1411316 RepID=UPI003C36317A
MDKRKVNGYRGIINDMLTGWDADLYKVGGFDRKFSKEQKKGIPFPSRKRK